MKKVAILLTGDVRECDARNTILQYFKNYDIYHGTYDDNAEYVCSFPESNRCFINRETDIRPPLKLEKSDIQVNMLQWLHLDNLLKKYESQLLKYDIIVRYRYDCILLNENIFDTITPEKNVIYNQSDFSFFGEAKTFVNTFKCFYDNIYSTYDYVKHRLKDEHESSWKSEQTFKEHIIKMGMKSKVIKLVQVDRGKYVKVDKSGNKKYFRCLRN